MSYEPPAPRPVHDTIDEPGPHIFEPDPVGESEPAPPRPPDPAPGRVPPSSGDGGDRGGRRTLALAAVFAALLGGAVAAAA